MSQLANNNNNIYVVSFVSPDLIDPFAHQARQIFHPQDLGTLLESIRNGGIKTPLTVRPSPTNSKRYELVAGERRLRAAKELGRIEVPVFIRQLTDAEAEEESLVENMARVNLTPVEEAKAFRRMLELTSEDGSKLYTIARLAQKIGRGESEIRHGLKILNAPDTLLRKIDVTKDDREVSVEVVALVGRIPDPKARERAAADVLSGVSSEGGVGSGKPLNVVEARKLMRSKYMSKIDLSAKEAEDEGLVPLKKINVGGQEERVHGGSCKDCPFRSGCITDIADLLQEGSAGAKGGQKAGVDPNICTKPSCLQMKRDALWSRKCEKHLQDGGRVMTDAEAKKEFPYGDWLRHNSEMAKLSDQPDYRVFNKHSPGKWSELIKGLPVIVTLARTPAGKEQKLINVKEAAALVKERFRSAASPEDSQEVAAAKAAREKELRAEKVEKESIKLGLQRIEQQITTTGLSVEQWPQFFEVLLGNAGADGMTVLGQWLDIKLPKGGHHSGRDYEDKIIELVKTKVSTVNGWVAWCALASIARGIKYGGANAADYSALLEALEIDPKSLKAEAAKVVDAKLKSPEAKQKKAKKGPLKPGEKGDTKDRFDKTQSGAAVEEVDLLIREEEPAAPVHDKEAEQKNAARLSKLFAGEEDWQARWDALPQKPKKGSPELKAWDAARKRIKRGAEKAGVVLV